MTEPVKPIFTPAEVEALHRYQFGPLITTSVGKSTTHMRMHPFTCPNRGDDQHFDNGADLGALIPTTRGWICQSCDYTQDWAHDFMKRWPKS